MKTPREIIFARQQAVMPKLDAIRREVVTRLDHQDTRAQSWAVILLYWCLGGSNKLWRELFLPSRRTWTGLAAVWLLLFLINFSQRDGSPTAGSGSAPMAMMSIRDQQKLLNELFADRSPPMEAEQPRIFSPKPRTEKSEASCV